MTDAYDAAQAFRRDVRAAAKRLKELDKPILKQFKADAKERIGEPLAVAMRAAAPQPWAVPIRKAITATGGQVPGIKLGSGNRAVTDDGRALGRDLIPGVEWGGGTRVKSIVRREKFGRVLYSRKTTIGFRKHHHPFVYEVISKRADMMRNEYLKMIDDVLSREWDN